MIQKLNILISCAVLFARTAVADDAPLLPGSELKVKDVATKRETIFVAQIKEITGGVQMEPIGKLHYAAKINILRILQGIVDAQANFEICRWLQKREQVPEVGSSYIFFIRGASPENYVVDKIVPASSANVDAVQRLISN